MTPYVIDVTYPLGRKRRASDSVSACHFTLIRMRAVLTYLIPLFSTAQSTVRRGQNPVQSVVVGQPRPHPPFRMMNAPRSSQLTEHLGWSQFKYAPESLCLQGTDAGETAGCCDRLLLFCWRLLYFVMFCFVMLWFRSSSVAALVWLETYAFAGIMPICYTHCLYIVWGQYLNFPALCFTYWIEKLAGRAAAPRIYKV